MIYTVDRIEGDLAVLEREDRQMQHLPLSELPTGLREGDKLTQTAEGWQLRPDLRAQQMAKNRALLDRLKRR